MAELKHNGSLCFRCKCLLCITAEAPNPRFCCTICAAAWANEVTKNYIWDNKRKVWVKGQ